MKKIRIANGIKRIEESDSNAAMFRLRDVLSEHRNILITRLLSDLGTYIDYKFSMRADSRQIETVKESLLALKNSVLDLDKYSGIVEHFYEHDMTFVKNEPFMHEIDENIAMALNLSQMKLV
jgi:hypothetical protein